MLAESPVCCLLLREGGSLDPALGVKERLTPTEVGRVAEDDQNWGVALVRAALLPFWDKWSGRNQPAASCGP